MHVVLVLPPYDIASSYGSSKKMLRGNLPPLGVGYLAASLEPRGHTVALVDAVALGIDIAETVERITAEHPEIIGISCLTKQAPSAYALCEALKRRCPDVPLVVGGAHATSFAEKVIEECPYIDVLVPGEGERVFAELVDRLSRKQGYADLSGIIFRNTSRAIQIAPVAEAERNLDRIPNPARHIYQHDLYHPLPNQARRQPATTVITSRGCPWGKCAFCYQGGKYAQRFRQRSPEHVIEEITHLVRDYGIREIIFWDDNFGVSRKWVMQFCDRLDEAHLDITWTAQMRVSMVTAEMLKRMAASGCYNVYYGFETGNQELLDLVDKGITLEQSRNAVAWAKQAGLAIRGSFILGFPTETPAMTEKTIRFACELNIDWMIFFPYHVHEGTRLAPLALREGRRVPIATGMHFPSYVPNTYPSAAALEAMVKRAYRRYYVRPGYIVRALWRCRKPSTLKNYVDAAVIWVDMMRSKRGSA